EVAGLLASRLGPRGRPILCLLLRFWGGEVAGLLASRLGLGGGRYFAYCSGSGVGQLPASWLRGTFHAEVFLAAARRRNV
ncbi:hypothetical protein RZS08_00985, partial [Arthrospira platensis SPKY1]|nr:hypothetical protein [Arthrospira platensis SPKY1]